MERNGTTSHQNVIWAGKRMNDKKLERNIIWAAPEEPVCVKENKDNE
jgi:hypothetical protein